MNRAAEMASGEMILFLNAGDLFHSKDTVSRLMARRNAGADIVYGNHIYKKAGRETFQQSWDFRTAMAVLRKGMIWKEWLARFPAHQATMTRTTLLREMRYDTAFRVCADHDFFLRAVDAGATTQFVDEIVAIYAGGGFSDQRASLLKLEWSALHRAFSAEPGLIDAFYWGGASPFRGTRSAAAGEAIVGLMPERPADSTRGLNHPFRLFSGDGAQFVTPRGTNATGLHLRGTNPFARQMLTALVDGAQIAQVRVPKGIFAVDLVFDQPPAGGTIVEVVSDHSETFDSESGLVSLALREFEFSGDATTTPRPAGTTVVFNRAASGENAELLGVGLVPVRADLRVVARDKERAAAFLPRHHLDADVRHAVEPRRPEPDLRHQRERDRGGGRAGERHDRRRREAGLAPQRTGQHGAHPAVSVGKRRRRSARSRHRARQRPAGVRGAIMKICFVGHSFHERTGSTRFIQKILGEIGTVTVLHSSPDDPRLADDAVVLEYLNNDYDLWVFLQTEYVAARLLPLGLRNAVIIPMYDGVWSHPADYWRQFVNCRFATFSRTLHTHLQTLDQRSASFEYWPEPAAPVARDTAPEAWSAFFWERKPNETPNARMVAKQCRALKIGKLHVHAVPDFAHEAASAHGYRRRDTLDGVALTTSDWFEDRAGFEAVSGAPLFHFAPRLREGIGMTTLEAMARGQVVIAPDLPTANEYIGHRASGVLYDPDRPTVLPELSEGEVQEISAAARSRVEFGHRAWQQDRERFVSFLLDDGKRWPTTDSSAHFGLEIRRAARARKLERFAK